MRRIANKIPEAGRLSSIPASLIDKAYLNKPSGLIKRIIKCNLYSSRIFNPPYSVAIYRPLRRDGLGIRYAIGSFFVTDDLQDQRLQQQRKYGTIFSKNLYALLAMIFGFN